MLNVAVEIDKVEQEQKEDLSGFTQPYMGHPLTDPTRLALLHARDAHQVLN